MLGHVAKHRVQRERTGFWMFGRRRERDSLFERSFRTCSGCGEDVYVLAEDCRECGRAVELVAV
jgi:predicted amidophosphoribosyltransferase